MFIVLVMLESESQVFSHHCHIFKSTHLLNNSDLFIHPCWSKRFPTAWCCQHFVLLWQWYVQKDVWCSFYTTINILDYGQNVKLCSHLKAFFLSHIFLYIALHKRKREFILLSFNGFFYATLLWRPDLWSEKLSDVMSTNRNLSWRFLQLLQGYGLILSCFSK